MNATSPKSSLAKLGLYPRQKALKVMVLGQSGVGKSAMVVRFITKRYIGEYDPTLEKVYTFHTVIDDESVYFDILDTAGQPHRALTVGGGTWEEDYINGALVELDHSNSKPVLELILFYSNQNSWTENECLALEANIRWAEAFILMYSVTDKCSFDECYRLKFLINYNKRRRRLGSTSKDGIGDIPVVLVGNKIDQMEDRMVSLEEGQRRSKEIGCVCFHEISVKESIEQVWSVFRDVCRFWRVLNKNPSRIRRSVSEKEPTSPDSARLLCSAAASPGSTIPSCRPAIMFSRRWTEVELDEEEEDEERGSKESNASSPSDSTPFRERASTDGLLQHKPWRWRYPPVGSSNSGGSQEGAGARSERRMSISMRGNNASY